MVKPESNSRDFLLGQLTSRIIGQPDALEAIIPAVQLYKAGLSPEGRPAGAFMLLGPTGVGKSLTVEALADVIHGSPRNVLRIDCAEYQLEHEVARLIGAPPGYLGHRETQPGLSQMKLNGVMSDRANLSLVLFDEIEKAAPSLLRLLLGILDKGRLTLGDNSTVQFERTMIFFTTNLGAAEMRRVKDGGVGFVGSEDKARGTGEQLAAACMGAVKRKFAPEFINRIDGFLTYNYLSPENIRTILEKELNALAAHVSRRLGDRQFFIQVPTKTRDWLIERGFSTDYGARELKRIIATNLLHPIADHVNDGLLEPGAIITFTPASDGERLNARILGAASDEAATPETPATTTVSTRAGNLSYIIKSAK